MSEKSDRVKRNYAIRNENQKKQEELEMLRHKLTMRTIVIRTVLFFVLAIALGIIFKHYDLPRVLCGLRVGPLQFAEEL